MLSCKKFTIPILTSSLYKVFPIYNFLFLFLFTLFRSYTPCISPAILLFFNYLMSQMLPFQLFLIDNFAPIITF